MTWKLKGYSSAYTWTEFPTDEFWEHTTNLVYRRLFMMTHPQAMTAGSSYNTVFAGAGHGVGTIVRAELLSAAGGGGWNACWRSIDVIRQAPTILTLQPSANLSINGGANSIRAVIWYTKTTGIY